MKSRVGNFSSSQIYRLMSKGQGKWSNENVGEAFNSYVKEKRWERKLGRSLNKDFTARATSWGTLVEKQCFNKLDLSFRLESDVRYTHKDYPDYWTGMPDIVKNEFVGDIKCPWTLESFMDLVECFEDVELLKKSKPMYYWQLVSNSILCDKPKALLFAYVPYKKDIEEIRTMASNMVEGLQNQYAFINWADDSELPYLPNDSDISDVNVIEFEVSEKDKQLLTERVKLAITKL